MPLGFGTAIGLSYKNNFNDDMQLLAANAERVRVKQAEADAKLSYYREKFKMPDVSNDYDRKQVEGIIQNTVKEVQSFEAKDPNWAHSLEGQLGFEAITNRIVQNDAVLRDKRIKLNYEQFKKDAADNKLTTPEIEKYDAQFSNYNKYGNIDGPGSDEVKEFSYKSPKPFDFDALLAKHVSLGTKESGFKREGNKQYTVEELSDADATIQASSMYADNYEEIDKLYKSLPSHVTASATPLAWVKANLLSHSKRKIGNVLVDPVYNRPNPTAEEIAAQMQQYTPYRTNIYNPFVVQGEKKGMAGTVTPFIQTEGDRIISNKQSFIKIGNKEVPFNLKGRKVSFQPVVSSEKGSSTKKGGNTAKTINTNMIESYDNNGQYDWKRFPTTTGDDGFIFYPVKMDKNEFEEMLLTTGDPDNINSTLTKWYNLNKKEDGSVIFDLGTPMNIGTHAGKAAEDKYNRNAGVNSKTQEYNAGGSKYVHSGL